MSGNTSQPQAFAPNCDNLILFTATTPLPDIEGFPFAEALIDPIGENSPTSSVTLITGLVIILGALITLVLVGKELVLCRSRRQLGASSGFLHSWRNYLMLGSVLLDALFYASPAYLAEVPWYDKVPFKTVMRAATMAGIRSVPLYGLIFCILVLFIALQSVLNFVTGIAHCSRNRKAKLRRKATTNKVAPAPAASGSGSGEADADEENQLRPASGTMGVAGAWGGGAGAQAAAEAVDSDVEEDILTRGHGRVNPESLANVTGHSLGLYLLASSLLTPMLMILMSPFVCGFPFGEDALYIDTIDTGNCTSQACFSSTHIIVRMIAAGAIGLALWNATLVFRRQQEGEDRRSRPPKLKLPAGMTPQQRQQLADSGRVLDFGSLLIQPRPFVLLVIVLGRLELAWSASILARYQPWLAVYSNAGVATLVAAVVTFTPRAFYFHSIRHLVRGSYVLAAIASWLLAASYAFRNRSRGLGAIDMAGALGLSGAAAEYAQPGLPALLAAIWLLCVLVCVLVCACARDRKPGHKSGWFVTAKAAKAAIHTNREAVKQAEMNARLGEALSRKLSNKPGEPEQKKSAAAMAQLHSTHSVPGVHAAVADFDSDSEEGDSKRDVSDVNESGNVVEYDETKEPWDQGPDSDINSSRRKHKKHRKHKEKKRHHKKKHHKKHKKHKKHHSSHHDLTYRADLDDDEDSGSDRDRREEKKEEPADSPAPSKRDGKGLSFAESTKASDGSAGALKVGAASSRIFWKDAPPEEEGSHGASSKSLHSAGSMSLHKKKSQHNSALAKAALAINKDGGRLEDLLEGLSDSDSDPGMLTDRGQSTLNKLALASDRMALSARR